MKTAIRLETGLGTLLLLAEDEGLAGVWFEGQKHFPKKVPACSEVAAGCLLDRAARQIEAYLDGRLTDFDLPLAPAGTAFQQAVWEALRAIPHGQTVTYGELAARIGRPGCGRAVGAAVGRNPISIVIPCHRVIGADGRLTGYAGGLERKEALLHLERSFRSA